MSVSTARDSKTERNGGQSVPLESGDRLSAGEFLRRYEAMPQVKKAELIEGTVYMGSPVRYRVHGRPEALIHLWLSHYEAQTPGVEFVPNTTTQLDVENVPQPDALLRLGEECGGQSRIDARDYLVGPPELVVEIAASSASIDLHEKLRAYRRSGVKEYLTWRTLDGEFDWRISTAGDFLSLNPDREGVLRSQTFPGLWLSVKALLKRDAGAMLTCLNAGLRSREHRAFVARLAGRRRSRR